MKLRAAVSRFDEGRVIRYRQSVPAITTLDPGKIYHSESSHFLHEGGGPGTFMTVPVNFKDRVIGIIALAIGRRPRSTTTRGSCWASAPSWASPWRTTACSRKIQDTSNYLASIINESPDAMLTTDNEGLIVSASTGARPGCSPTRRRKSSASLSARCCRPAAGWSRAAKGRATSASSSARTARWSR